ncbi:hypothetical protein MMA231_03930 (plasmid) [Asticcacaulis sp. MM231]|uniref:TonB-dependent receptor n=1 Tax=Asticcacaulis sp. MM231 TaxID=3157666 RepID=UPI0032D56A8A
MLTTTTRKTWLLAATGMAVAMICSPALAQDAAPATATSTTAAPVEDADTVVIVKGLRKSLKSAVDRKRKSAQIVDSIDAEDVGKLPDNNVTEAISRVTGVQITRERGEGGSVAIRGQTDISTTINGQEANSGIGRSAGLNDIPAELLKSVQVYKTRTADQVEGGIAGTVNVDLRRPLDLPKGWTVAGSARTVMSDVGDTNSPYFSALVANRWDTAMGEMGFLLNLSYQKNNYNEQYAESETPRPFFANSTELNSLPADLKSMNGGLGPFFTYKTRYGVERGYVERPSINAGFQWRVNEHLDFLVEGTIFNAEEHRQLDVLEARGRDTGAVLSNVVMMPNGLAMKSATFTGANLQIGPYANDDVSKTENTHLNFEVHWHKDRWNVNAAITSDENGYNAQWYRETLRFTNLTGYSIDMDSDKTEGGAPYVQYNGLDLSNPDNYILREFENGKRFENSKQMSYQLDMTYHFSDDKFFRDFQFGVRHTSRDISRAYGYRYAGWNGAKTIALSDFPSGDSLDAVTIKVPGLDSPTWYRLNLDGILNNYDDILALAANSPSYSGGSGGWDDLIVDTENGFGSFVGTEKTSAIYAQFTYGFNAFNFPVDGVVGVRQAGRHNTSVSKGFPRLASMETGVVLDGGLYCPEGTAVGALGCSRTVDGSDSDILPSVNAVIHFMPKLQMRLAYTQNVERPGFDLATSWASIDTSENGCRCGWGGNPDLKPNHETSYDASLEYYFGRGGVVSFAAYLKKPDGFIIWVHDVDAPVPGYEGLYTWDHPMNAGPGTFQGYEFTAQGFFDFLPGKWANFGGQFNYTYNQVAKIKYCYDYPDCVAGGDFNATGNSPYTYNLALYYDTPQLSARVAYNYRARYRDSIDNEYSAYSLYVEPTSRLDASISYTPIKQLTLSLEATNLLHDNTKRWWGEQRLLPMGIRVQARTIQMSARFRY